MAYVNGLVRTYLHVQSWCEVSSGGGKSEKKGRVRARTRDCDGSSVNILGPWPARALARGRRAAGSLLTTNPDFCFSLLAPPAVCSSLQLPPPPRLAPARPGLSVSAPAQAN